MSMLLLHAQSGQSGLLPAPPHVPTRLKIVRTVVNEGEPLVQAILLESGVPQSHLARGPLPGFEKLRAA
jgi:hypothetical protein